MSFCPVPHTARDQAWLAVGVGLGALGWRCCGFAKPLASSDNVSPLAAGPVRVCVEFNDVRDPEKFKQLYKGVVAGTRTKDAGCVQVNAVYISSRMRSQRLNC